MMSSLGPYAIFILTAYAICAAVIVGLIANVVFDYRRQQRSLRDMEARGIGRRSSEGGAS